MNNIIIDRLLNSEEPSIRYKVFINLLDEHRDSKNIKKLQEEIRNSHRVIKLLSERDKSGRILFHPYSKWDGAHWILSMLAEIDYPCGDETLIPLREQVYEWLFSKHHKDSIKIINGKTRRCASQEGNALWYLLKLGIYDDRTDELARRLIKWQWPDGGWNCDRNPDAENSSFMESLLPLRGLSLYSKIKKDKVAEDSARKASEIFLKRKMYKIKPRKRWRKEDFLKLHYPCYWHYDILFGLKVMAEAGFINDKRCEEAIEILMNKRLDDWVFSTEEKFYRVTERHISGRSLVQWGKQSKKELNEFVTADALFVLKNTGRIEIKNGKIKA